MPAPDPIAPDPIEAFLTALSSVEPNAPTACTLWTAHEVASHLAASLDECVELIEDALTGRPVRVTRSFEEREAPFRALPDDQLRRTLVEMLQKSAPVLEALADRGPDATFEFFDRSWTADQLQTHAANEFALHRWDLVGDDEIGNQLLSSPALARHCAEVLNSLPMLEEAPAARVQQGGLRNARVVLRSPDQADIALVAGADGEAHFEISDGAPLVGDAVVSTDGINRVLTLWGRQSRDREITISGNPALWSAVAATLWPDATPWPPQRGGAAKTGAHAKVDNAAEVTTVG